MAFAALPRSAAWQHVDARAGTECTFFTTDGISGGTAAIEDGEPWIVGYEIIIDPDAHRKRHVRVWNRTVAGTAEVTLVADGEGHWTVDGVERPELDGCFD